MSKIFFLPFFLIGVPYLGASFGRLGVYSLFSLILFSSLSMCFWIPYRKVDHLVLWFSLPLLVFLIGLINQVVYIKDLSILDIADLLQPISYLIYFTYGFVLASQIPFEKILNFVFLYLIALVFLNFIVSVGPFFISELSIISEKFGLGPEYHAGYAQYRAFGIVGQPGILGIFCNIIHVLLIFLLPSRNMAKRSNGFIFILIVLNVITLISSFSRINIGFFVVNNLLIYIFNYEVRRYLNYFLILTSLLCIYFIGHIIDLLPFLLRGVDFASGSLGTLGMRLEYKLLIIDLISENFFTAIFGIGPSKEFLEPPLRHPDSSFSLFLLRFGILGQILYLAPIVLGMLILKKTLFRCKATINNFCSCWYVKAIFVISVYLFLVAQLEPAYNDVKINFLYFSFLGIAFAVSKNIRRDSKSSPFVEEPST